MVSAGSVNSQIIGVVSGVWVIVILAIKHGVPGWSTLDKVCLACAVVGIALWQIFRDPILGVMVCLIAGVLGSFPTFASVWKDSAREDKTAWTIYSAACVLSTATIPRWTLADAAQPLVFLGIQAVMMYLLYVRPRTLGACAVAQGGK